MIGVQQKELALIEDPVERQSQLLEIARNAGKKIKKAALVMPLWEAVLENDGENIEALEQLEHAQERDKNWEGLAGTLGTLTRVVEDSAKKSQYLVKLGLLYSDKVKDNAAAIQTWESLHELEPDNRRAQDALKKLYLAEGNMEALEGFYAKQDKWSEFIRVLEREADSTEDDNRTELVLKIADLYKTRLEKPDRAIRDPREGALKRRRELGYRRGPDRAVRRGRRRAALGGAAGDQARAHRGSAGTPRTVVPFGRPQRACRPRRRPWPSATTVGLLVRITKRARPLIHLRRLAEGTGLWVELVASFEAACEKYGAVTESLELRLSVAEVYEKHLEEPEKALAANQAILEEIDPEQEMALASLERLYLVLGREQDLLAVLDTKLSLAESDEDKRQLQTRIGNIHEQLGNAEKAVEAYRAVLDQGAEEPSVLAALDRMYESLGRYEELADIIRRELDQQGEEVEPGTREGLLLRLAVIQQERLGNSEGAVELFQQVLAADIAHEEARVRLESWLEDDTLKVRVASHSTAGLRAH